VLERNSSLLHREDKDVTEGLETLFKDEGIKVILNATVKNVSGLSGESVRVTYHQAGVEKSIESSHLLAATGRTPNTENLGLELAGVELTERGYIKVNERLELRRRAFGRSVKWRVARNSRISPMTTSASCAITSPEGIA